MRYWMSVDPASPGTARPHNGNPLPLGKSTDAAVIVKDLLDPALRFDTVEVLVASRTNAPDPLVTCRTCTVALPPASFYKVSRGVFIASPELSFVQMGSVLPIAQLIEYGLRLCASFHITPYAETVERHLEKTTTPTRLANYAQKASGVAGAVKARQAAKYILAGAESPMEIKLEMLLCCPQRLGGYGLPKPLLNRTILPGKDAGIVDKGSYRPDLSWPDRKVAVEYDGMLAHLDVQQDKRRINDLETMGWKVISVTKRELYDAILFDKLARKLAKCLGSRIRTSAGWHARVAQLRHDLNLQ